MLFRPNSFSLGSRTYYNLETLGCAWDDCDNSDGNQPLNPAPSSLSSASSLSLQAPLVTPPHPPSGTLQQEYSSVQDRKVIWCIPSLIGFGYLRFEDQDCVSPCLLSLLDVALTRNFAGGLPATPVTALHAIVMLIRNSRAFSAPAASEKSGQKTPGAEWSPAGRAIRSRREWGALLIR